jgi:multidrug efflux pump subunit AcrA (membrane-fusion protein)
MNKKKVLLPVLLLALGVGGFVALKATRPKPPQAVVKEPVWRVQAMSAQISKLSPVTRLNGRVESPEQTKAAAPGTGRVLQVAVREGQAVQPGQHLLELDPRDFQPRVDQARGEVDELQAAIGSEQLRHQADLDQLKQERQLLDFAAADVGALRTVAQGEFLFPKRRRSESPESGATTDHAYAAASWRWPTIRRGLLQLQARLSQVARQPGTGRTGLATQPSRG